MYMLDLIPLSSNVARNSKYKHKFKHYHNSTHNPMNLVEIDLVVIMKLHKMSYYQVKKESRLSVKAIDYKIQGCVKIDKTNLSLLKKILMLGVLMKLIIKHELEFQRMSNNLIIEIFREMLAMMVVKKMFTMKVKIY